jgi:predicted nucleotidyltransferase
MDSKTALAVGELKSHLVAVYRQRLARLVLFGSRARGDADPGSDIDVMVVLKGAVKPGAEISRAGGATAALSLKHNVVISCTFVSEERFLNEQSPLLINVRREGMPI